MEDETQHHSTKWKLRDAFEIADWEVEPLEWLVKPIIPKGTIGFISGQPKLGKSLLGLDLCLHLSHGFVSDDSLWLDRFHCAPAAILYIAREDPARRIRERALEMQQSYGWDASPLGLQFLIRERLNLTSGDHTNWLIRTIEELRMELLVLDVFNRMIPDLDENSARDMARAIDVIEKVNRETGVTIIMVDHTRKPLDKDSKYRAPSPHDLRGSSAKYGCADFMICLSRTKQDGQLQVYCENKDHDEHLEFLVDVSPKGSGDPKFRWAGEVQQISDLKAVGEHNRQRVAEVVLEKGPVSKKEISQKTDLSSSTVGSHLSALVQRGVIDRIGTNKNTKYAKGTAPPKATIRPGRSN